MKKIDLAVSVILTLLVIYSGLRAKILTSPPSNLLNSYALIHVAGQRHNLALYLKRLAQGDYCTSIDIRVAAYRLFYIVAKPEIELL